MTTRWRPYSSTVGSKLLIALTGIALIAYLVVHLAGNLLLFLGPGTFNSYAHTLVSNPLIVVVEIGLAAIFIVHAYETFVTWLRNRRARPLGYHKRQWARGASRKSVASTTMIYTGAFTLLFVVLHVRTFRYGTYYQTAGSDARDLYRLVIEVFRDPLTVAFYEVALVLAGLHLWHGFSSAVESLGGNHPRYTPLVMKAGRLISTVLAGGFLLIPLWVHFGGGRQ
ncbi:MAG: succinate dehydrogenase cytochrome b subunit [Vicinamibacterales bacterium]